MRDPGRPRRNPFFEHGSDGHEDDPGIGWRDAADDAADDASPDPDPVADPAGSGFAALLAVIEALGDAQPEAAEHVVAAAHEVVLTVKVLVDATEAALADQRAAMAASRVAQAAQAAQGAAPEEPAAEVTDLTERRRAESELP